MDEPKTKRIPGKHLAVLLACFVCLIGLSISGTYLFMRARNQNRMDSEYKEETMLRKDNKDLSDRNSDLLNSLQKLESEFGILQSQSKELASKLDSAEEKNVKTTSELAAALKELEAAKADISRFTVELDAKLSQMEDINADRQALQQKYHDYKKMLGPNLVLEPTWVSSGETIPAFDGSLLIVVYDVSEKDKCRRDSVAVGYLIRGADKKKLCLETGKPEDFKYQGKEYLFNLLEEKGSEETKRYCISILKQK
jgi:septal ring factor EnvC (AmiA/AmiB activator)